MSRLDERRGTKNSGEELVKMEVCKECLKRKNRGTVNEFIHLLECIKKSITKKTASHFQLKCKQSRKLKRINKRIKQLTPLTITIKITDSGMKGKIFRKHKRKSSMPFSIIGMLGTPVSKWFECPECKEKDRIMSRDW